MDKWSNGEMDKWKKEFRIQKSEFRIMETDALQHSNTPTLQYSKRIQNSE
jgi:hypothetical protein